MKRLFSGLRAVYEALARRMGLAEEPVRRRDVGDLGGTWREDPEFDRTIAGQDRVDEELWR